MGPDLDQPVASVETTLTGSMISALYKVTIIIRTGGHVFRRQCTQSMEGSWQDRGHAPPPPRMSQWSLSAKITDRFCDNAVSGTNF